MLPSDVSIPAKQNLCSYITGNYKQKYILYYVLSQNAYISHVLKDVTLQLIQGNRLKLHEWKFIRSSLRYVQVAVVLLSGHKIRIVSWTAVLQPAATLRSWHCKRGKAVPLLARSGPEGSRKLRFPDFVTTAQGGVRLSALPTGRLYPQEILLVLISVVGRVAQSV